MAMAAAASLIRPAPLAAAPRCSRRCRQRWMCKAVKQEEEEEAMMDVGLEDVFSLIAQAQEAFPEGRQPEELVAGDKDRERLPATPAGRWYGVYGRSVPRTQDARAVFYGPRRPLWPGPVAQHLKGEFPGDYGVDVLSLCKDPAAFQQLRAKEVMNGRWAMVAVAGCLLPDAVGVQPVWFDAAAEHFLRHPAAADAALVLFLLLAERARSVGAESVDSLYPGGKSFDPLGFANDAESFAELKVKEVKNGRLAMLAMAALFAQAAATGQGPLENLHHLL